MSDSVKRRVRRFQEQVGDLGTVKVWMGKDDEFRWKIKCLFCRDSKGLPWTSNKYLSPFARPDLYDKDVSLARWVNHLECRHDEVTVSHAPCVTFEWLDEACDREYAYDDRIRTLVAEVFENFGATRV